MTQAVSGLTCLMVSLMGMNEHPALRPIYQLSEKEVAPFADPAARVIKKHGGKYAKQLEGFSDIFALIAGANIIYQSISAKREATLESVKQYAQQGDPEAVEIFTFYANKKQRGAVRQPSRPQPQRSDPPNVQTNGAGGRQSDIDLRSIIPTAP